VSAKRKRKRRHAAAAPQPLTTPARPPSRSETKDAAARAALVPLREGERPTAVTVGAIVALVLAVGNLIAYAAGFEIEGSRPRFATVAFQALLMLVAAWGMWRARYWAVLGMEAILAILIVIVALSAFTASSVWGVLLAAAIAIPAGTLFWKLVRAMARLQMPERP
jgi:hypothetical protein